MRRPSSANASKCSTCSARATRSCRACCPGCCATRLGRIDAHRERVRRDRRVAPRVLGRDADAGRAGTLVRRQPQPGGRRRPHARAPASRDGAAPRMGRPVRDGVRPSQPVLRTRGAGRRGRSTDQDVEAPARSRGRTGRARSSYRGPRRRADRRRRLRQRRACVGDRTRLVGRPPGRAARLAAAAFRRNALGRLVAHALADRTGREVPRALSPGRPGRPARRTGAAGAGTVGSHARQRQRTAAGNDSAARGHAGLAPRTTRCCARSRASTTSA